MLQIKYKKKEFGSKPFLATLVAMSVLISGCNSDDDAPVIPEVNSPESQVYFTLAPVDNGTCTIYNGSDSVASTETTSGVATFQDIPASLGMVLIECEGGQYEDEASGEQLTAGRTRSYFDVTSSTFTASITPLIR